MTRATKNQQDSMKGKWERFRCDGTLFKMPWLVQLPTPEHIIKQDIKAEKLGSHWKLKDRNVTVVGRI